MLSKMCQIYVCQAQHFVFNISVLICQVFCECMYFLFFRLNMSNLCLSDSTCQVYEMRHNMSDLRLSGSTCQVYEMRQNMSYLCLSGTTFQVYEMRHNMSDLCLSCTTCQVYVSSSK